MDLNKKDIIRVLEQIAVYMELQDESPFKSAAYRKAAMALEMDERGLGEIEDFTALQGIGKGTAAVIDELTATGSSMLLQELQAKVPKGLIPLLQLQGLGAKKIAKLYKELNVIDIDSLKEACENKQVRGLKGFGVKTEEKILASIDEYGKRPERIAIGYMLKYAKIIEDKLTEMKDIETFSRAGSLRRFSETMKDLDYIIATRNPEKVKAQLLELNEASEAIASGNTKVSITLADAFGISVDFRMVKPEEYATALHHFTGSKEHNVRMRQLAKERGEKISEYGVESLETGEVKTFSSEEEFYAHFSLPLIPPEIRNDGREIEEYNGTEALICLEDIKGDLHMHTTWSDGANTLEEMIQACREKGYKYMAVTDHSQYLKVANGLTAQRLKKQQEEIRRLNEKYEDILILSGIEMDILPDGSLDFDDDLLKELDIVIASIHSSFNQPREKIMEKLRTVLENPHVDIIAHPTGRLIGGRPGYSVDIDMLIELAKETNTALELNASPSRLDLSAENIRKAQEQGVTIVVNTDAHETEQLINMEFGIGTARRGWIQKETVLNAMAPDGLLEFLKRHDNE